MKSIIIIILISCLYFFSCSEYNKHRISYKSAYIINSDSLAVIELDSLFVFTQKNRGVQKDILKLKNGKDTLLINNDIVKTEYSYVLENGKKLESMIYYELIDPNNKVCAKLRVIYAQSEDMKELDNVEQHINISGNISRFPKLLTKDLLNFNEIMRGISLKTKQQSKGRLYDYGTLKEVDLK